MRFIIFVIDGPNNPASPDEMQKIDAFNEKLRTMATGLLPLGFNRVLKQLLLIIEITKVK